MDILAFKQHLKKAHALIIIPPFASINRPSLGAHILQACCEKENITVSILYANILLASEIGVKEYESICYAPSTGLLGERFFSKNAYGIDAASAYPNSDNTGHIRTSKDTGLTDNLKDYQRLALQAGEWIEQLTDVISEIDYLVVGCSSTFEQTTASVALLNKIKAKNNSVITVIGGANCEGEMAEGIESLQASIDYIFSGECEDVFPMFMRQCISNSLPINKIINGVACENLNSLPTLDYSEFYSQFNLIKLLDHEVCELWLPYESSRGCWWGSKKQCLFCGINGDGLQYREKSYTKVLDELNTLMKHHPTANVCMVDNVMPFSYFETLLPLLARKTEKYHFFYEQKSNLTLDKIELLKKAGVGVIQPGIESLSTSLLKHMNKGVTAKQNLNLLRYSRMLDLAVNWNVLHSFPNDRLLWYTEALYIMECIFHLHPPTAAYALSIDRFSPYFNNPQEYGISNLTPLYSYSEIFPQDSDLFAIAYHFEADFKSESKSNPEFLNRMESMIKKWKGRWNATDRYQPVLHINRLNDSKFLLVDTRDENISDNFSFIDKGQVVACLFGEEYVSNREVIDWSLEKKVCIMVDECCMPLATTAPHVYRDILNEAKLRPIQ